MSNELEEQIRGWVDDQVDGVAPVTVDEAIAHASSPTVVPTAGARDRRQRWVISAVAAAAIMFVGAVGVMTLSDSESPERVVSAAKEGKEEEADSDGGDGGPGRNDSTAACTIVAETAAPVDLNTENDGKTIAQLKIPRIGVDHAVVEGESVEALQRGPGHYSGTPLPGQPGNSAIAGHRTTFGAPFRDIGDLSKGDQIIVQTWQGMFVYEIDRIEIVRPNQVETLEDKGDNRITLTSCHPKYSMRQRIVVSGELVGEPAQPIGQPVHPIGFAWLPPEAEVFNTSPPQSLIHSPAATLIFKDAPDGAVDEERYVQVTTNTVAGALLFTRVDMDAAEPEVEPELIPGVSARRERIELRGVEVVHDKAVDGNSSSSRLIFFDSEDLAVEVRARNVSDDDLYRIIEELRLVAVGGP